ncbi:MAG: ribonuclease HI [Calditrichia bacterium]|nr:ribonuclease HI [Calditrichia bacterium]MCK5453485.1 ribonuclease HI [Calditrichia bacterium]
MNQDNLPEVTIYTDGACTGNPGPGAYGVVLLYKNIRKEISRGFRKTTNNRMELMALIAGLSSLQEKCRVTLYTDSKYVADSINQGWAERWQAQGWRRTKRERALNPDLWEELLALLEEHQISVIWVKGHAGNPENERADALAVQTIKSKNLAIDDVYENQLQ